LAFPLPTGLQLGGLALSGDPGARSAVASYAKRTVQGIGQGLGYAATHPFEVGESLMNQIRSNPAESAGMAMGMLVPFGKKPFGKYPAAEKLAARDPYALEYGQYIMHRAERRIDDRIRAERARMEAWQRGQLGEPVGKPGSPDIQTNAQKAYWARVEQLRESAARTPSGSPEWDAYRDALQTPMPTTELDLGATVGGSQLTGPIESFGDEIAQLQSVPDATLQQIYKNALHLWKSAGELGNPYQKGFLQEFARRGIKPDISDELHILEEGTPGTPGNVWTREERGGDMLKGLEFPNPKPGHSIRMEVVNHLNRNFPNEPVGTRRGQYVKTTKGWTHMGPEWSPQDLWDEWNAP